MCNKQLFEILKEETTVLKTEALMRGQYYGLLEENLLLYLIKGNIFWKKCQLM